MKKQITYIAFDNTEFSSEKECLDYEASGWKNEVIKTEKRLQQLKSNELAEEYKTYKKALDNYRYVCEHKVSEQDRLTKYNRYLTAKDRYDKTVLYFNQTKKRLRFLKEKAKLEKKD